MRRLLALFGLLAGLLTAVPAFAQISTPSHIAILGGAPSAAPFVLPAVLVTQEASPTIPTATIANSAFIDANFWFRCAEGSSGAAPDKYQTCYNSVLVGNWSNTPCSNLSSAETMPGFNVVWEQGENGGIFRFNFNNAHCPGGALGAPNDNNSANAAYGPSPATDNLATGWHHMRVFGDMAQSCNGGTARCGGVFIDNAQVVFGLNDIGAGGWTAASKIIAFNSAPFFVNAFENTSPVQAPNAFEISQFSMDTSVSPVVAGTNTPVNPIANFMTPAGGPIDYKSDCSGPYRHAPGICSNGSGAAFLTNTGTLGTNWSITQSVTNAFTNQLYAAAYGPGEVPDRPFRRWQYTTNFGGSCAESAGTCAVASNAGNEILLGDMLCAAFTVSLNGSTQDNFTLAAAGYTQVIASTLTNSQNFTVWCKVATSGDVTARGNAWTSPTWTWTNGASGFGGGAQITIIDIGRFGSGGTTPRVNTSNLTANVANGSLALPSCTAPSGFSLWMGIHTTYSWSFGTVQTAPPSTSTLSGKTGTGNKPGGNVPLIEYEKISAPGSLARTAQESAAIGNPSIAACIVFN